MQRDRHACADCECVGPGYAPGTKRLGGGIGVAVETKLKDLLAQRGQQLPGAIERDDLTAVHDRDAIGQTFGLVEIVRGHEDRDLLARPQPGDHVEQLVADARVEPHGRLVQEQHLRLGHERPGDLEAPALAAAIAGHGPIDQLGDPQHTRELVYPPRGACRVHSPQPGVQLEVLAAAQRAVDHGLLKDHAADTARLKRLPGHVIAGEPRSAARGGDRGGQHPDRGRLACAVGAEQAEHLAGRYVEVDALHSFHAPQIGLA